MNKTAVLINFYKEDLTDNEVLSLKRCVSILNSHDLFLLGPEGLSLKEYEKHAPNLKKHLVNENLFKGSRNYSKYMFSEGFYSDFKKYERILIYQLDCLVFKDELDYWASKDFDFIGAPLFEKFQYNENFVFLGLGNGGFSLRNPKSFYNLLKNWERLITYKGILESSFLARKKHKFKLMMFKFLSQIFFYKSHTPLNTILDQQDDSIWGLFLSKELGLISTPKPEEALKFSMEVHPKYLYELNNKELPFGCHAWEKYDYKFWKDFVF